MAIPKRGTNVLGLLQQLAALVHGLLDTPQNASQVEAFLALVEVIRQSSECPDNVRNALVPIDRSFPTLDARIQRSLLREISMTLLPHAKRKRRGVVKWVGLGLLGLGSLFGGHAHGKPVQPNSPLTVQKAHPRAGLAVKLMQLGLPDHITLSIIDERSDWSHHSNEEVLRIVQDYLNLGVHGYTITTFFEYGISPHIVRGFRAYGYTNQDIYDASYELGAKIPFPDAWIQFAEYLHTLQKKTKRKLKDLKNKKYLVWGFMAGVQNPEVLFTIESARAPPDVVTRMNIPEGGFPDAIRYIKHCQTLRIAESAIPRLYNEGVDTRALRLILEISANRNVSWELSIDVAQKINSCFPHDKLRRKICTYTIKTDAEFTPKHVEWVLNSVQRIPQDHLQFVYNLVSSIDGTMCGCLIAYAQSYSGLPIAKVKAIAKQAREKLNMVHFYRLKPDQLERVMNPSTSDIGKESILLLLPRSDWNGSFADFSGLVEDMLATNTSVHVYEIEREQGMYQRMKEVATRFGRIGFLVLGGHGSQMKMSFGDVDPRIRKLQKGEEFSLDVSDKEDIVVLGLQNYLAESCVIWNASCSNGKGRYNLACALHEGFNRAVVASRSPVSHHSCEWVITPDGHLVYLVIEDEENTLRLFTKRDPS